MNIYHYELGQDDKTGKWWWEIWRNATEMLACNDEHGSETGARDRAKVMLKYVKNADKSLIDVTIDQPYART